MAVMVYFRNGGHCELGAGEQVEHDRFINTKAGPSVDVRTEAGIVVKEGDGTAVGRFLTSEIVGYAIQAGARKWGAA